MAKLSQHSGVAVLHPAPQADAESDIPQKSQNRDRVLVTGAAFCLYWLSSILLNSHAASTYFGSDANVYALLAYGHVEERLLRFHPVTIVMALTWMDAFRALAVWIQPISILLAMFAMVGAAGVWAAMTAFAKFVPRREVPLWGAIYALSFGIWFFSSVAESKIVTATLAAIYIALYLHYREKPGVTRSALLALVFAVACLNEIVSALLIVLPTADAVLSGKLDRRRFSWLAAHALIAALALVALEVLRMYDVSSTPSNQESGSHFSMLLFYIGMNHHGPDSLYSFILNWLFFNIAAPSHEAAYATPIWPYYRGYFEPALLGYLDRPVTVALSLLVCGLMIAVVYFRRGPQTASGARVIALAFVAYTLARAVFFFLFNPPEALLFSPAVTLAHLLVLAIVFAGANFPGKRSALLALAILLLLTNSTFIFLSNTGVVPVPQTFTPSPPQSSPSG
jgi:hypothetical protein